MCKWARRYTEQRPVALVSQSRRPARSPQRKLPPDQERTILDLHLTRKLGARRIQSELRRAKNLSFLLATIHGVPERHSIGPLVTLIRNVEPKHYSRPITGKRVQLDTMNVASGRLRYTAVDDCARWLVLSRFATRSTHQRSQSMKPSLLSRTCSALRILSIVPSLRQVLMR